MNVKIFVFTVFFMVIVGIMCIVHVDRVMSERISHQVVRSSVHAGVMPPCPVPVGSSPVGWFGYYEAGADYARHDSEGRRIYNIPLSEELQIFTVEMSERFGVNHRLVFAIMHVESRFQVDVVSRGNYGIMQINQGNKRWLNAHLGTTDLLDPEQNIKAGIFWLSGIKANNHPCTHLILMVYNMGGQRALALWGQGIRNTAYSRAVVKFMESLEYIDRR